ncbi:MAG: hypothetical protein ACE5MM_01905 [Nitrospiraceae bacterium]
MRCVVSVVLIMIIAGGCGGPGTPDVVIMERTGNFVRVDPDPTAKTTRNTHPVSVPPDRLGALLASIEVKSPEGPFFAEEDEGPLFDPEDLAFLVPAVSKALAKANPTEWVVFYLQQSGRLLRPDVTTGAVAVREGSLSFTLGQYRRADVVGSEEENRDSFLENELRADPMFGVHDVGVRISVGAGQRWRPGDTPRTILFPLAPRSPSGKS